MNRKPVKYILEKLYRPWVVFYLRKDRSYRYKSLKLVVRQGVFHPGFFYSTSVFLKFLEGLQVDSRKVLELGAGSGLISLEMARRGARVYATDISIKATENIKENASLNHIPVQVTESDLFDSVQEKPFDIILINPPYYPRDPAAENEYAWYCGKDFGYFVKLFSGLRAFMHSKSQVFMILSEDCDLFRIKEIAREAGFEMKEIFSTKVFFELNFIFQIL